jgi:hypothetical protein
MAAFFLCDDRVLDGPASGERAPRVVRDRTDRSSPLSHSLSLTLSPAQSLSLSGKGRTESSPFPFARELRSVCSSDSQIASACLRVWGFVFHNSTEAEQFINLDEREIFIDNLLVRVHWIIEMIVVERPCAMGV